MLALPLGMFRSFVLSAVREIRPQVSASLKTAAALGSCRDTSTKLSTLPVHVMPVKSPSLTLTMKGFSRSSISHRTVVPSAVRPATSFSEHGEEAMFQERFAKAIEASSPVTCVAILDDMKEAGFSLPPLLILRAMRPCVQSTDVISAKSLFKHLQSCPSSQDKGHALQRSKSILGVVNATQMNPADVLKVMGWTQDAAEEDIEQLVYDMDLHRDDLSWGLVAWSLNKLGKPEETIRILDAATLYAGLPISDSISHLAISALGALGRFEEAKDVFASLRARHVVPHERTIGSLLHILTSHQLDKRGGRRRPPANKTYIRELCAIVSEPSKRFLSTCLRAYAACNLLEEAETTFERLSNNCEGYLPNERTCTTLMRLYGTHLINGAPDIICDTEFGKWSDAVAEKADVLWSRYFDVYGHLPPTYLEATARYRIFQRYILAKSAAGHVAEALTLITDALTEEGIRDRPWFEPTVQHFEALLYGVEQLRDVDHLYATLRVMAAANVQMSDSCLAAATAILVGNGDASRAAMLVCVHGHAILSASEVAGVTTRTPSRKRLLHWLRILDGALQQGSILGTLQTDATTSLHETFLHAKVRTFTKALSDQCEP